MGEKGVKAKSLIVPQQNKLVVEMKEESAKSVLICNSYLTRDPTKEFGLGV